MNDIFLIAEIKSVFNSNGFVKVSSFSDVPERFFQLEKVYIEIFGTYKSIPVEDVQILGKDILLKFRNFDSNKESLPLIGKKLFIDSKDSIVLPENSFFIHDLIGCRVMKDNVFFGELTEVMILSSNDVYVIKDLENNEVLIPAIKDYIHRFDKENKILYLLPGCDLDYAED